MMIHRGASKQSLHSRLLVISVHGVPHISGEIQHLEVHALGKLGPKIASVSVL